jgi:RNase P/RNase MRP subunit p29
MNYYPEEFIGSQLRVIEAQNKCEEGLAGKIIDETKKTITIIRNGEKKKIFKQGTTFLINSKLIRGELILQRPEERIKKK